MKDERQPREIYLDQLDDWLRRCTQGEWLAIYGDEPETIDIMFMGPGDDDGEDVVIASMNMSNPRVNEDAQILSQLKNDLPDLLAEIRRLNAEVKRLQAG